MTYACTASHQPNSDAAPCSAARSTTFRSTDRCGIASWKLRGEAHARRQNRPTAGFPRCHGCRPPAMVPDSINWLQDLYPEIAIERDVPFMQGPLASG